MTRRRHLTLDRTALIVGRKSPLHPCLSIIHCAPACCFIELVLPACFHNARTREAHWWWQQGCEGARPRGWPLASARPHGERLLPHEDSWRRDVFLVGGDQGPGSFRGVGRDGSWKEALLGHTPGAWREPRSLRNSGSTMTRLRRSLWMRWQRSAGRPTRWRTGCLTSTALLSRRRRSRCCARRV